MWFNYYHNIGDCELNLCYTNYSIHSCITFRYIFHGCNFPLTASIEPIFYCYWIKYGSVNSVSISNFMQTKCLHKIWSVNKAITCNGKPKNDLIECVIIVFNCTRNRRIAFTSKLSIVFLSLWNYSYGVSACVSSKCGLHWINHSQFEWRCTQNSCGIFSFTESN